jgi:Na+/proline symporter
LRRASAGISVLLLAVFTLAVAESALAALLVVFSYVLHIDVALGLGFIGPTFSSGPRAGPVVQLYSPTAVAVVLFTASSGLASAAWTFRRWRSAR